MQQKNKTIIWFPACCDICPVINGMYTTAGKSTIWAQWIKQSRLRGQLQLLMLILGPDKMSLNEKKYRMLYYRHRQYRFQNGLETGSCARIQSTQTVQEGPCCQRIAVANAVLAYSVEVWGEGVNRFTHTSL